MEIILVIGDYQLSSAFTTVMLVFLLLMITFTYLGFRYKKKQSIMITNRFDSTIELLFVSLRNYVATFVGDKYKDIFTPLSFVTFCTIFFANAVSLLGFTEGATDIAFPITLSISMFATWTGYALYKRGIINYLRGLLGEVAFLLPFEIIGRIMTPISMPIRVFGNVVSGYVIMTLLWALGIMLIQFSIIFIPVFAVIGGVLGGYFSLFSPFIQALVFTSLTLVNVGSLLKEKK